VHWLSAWTVHHANHLRPARDGLKVGGHQASSASSATILSALYFGVLGPHDRIAVKPHASPAWHAIQYLLGQQTVDQLQRFRAFGGAQSYPSRTKDQPTVDFSTGSVGLGVAVTACAALVQDYLQAHGRLGPDETGRMIALLGDAELDEGNIYEALLEGAKHDLRHCWWIVDYNRQSLDATTADHMGERFARIFAACDWEVHTLKYGRLLQAAFAEPGGLALRDWLELIPNDDYATLSYQGGSAWRQRLLHDLAGNADACALVARHDDDALATLMTNLAGHDLDLLVETFRGISSATPQLFLIYTIKGFGLPLQGHKDNHSGLLTVPQMEAYRERQGVAEGAEWDRFAGLPHAPDAYEALLAQLPVQQSSAHGRLLPAQIPVPGRDSFPRPVGTQSTQVAFGKVLTELARRGGALADALVTTSPDVTVSTNLGGFVNQRGLFSREPVADAFRDAQIASPLRWHKGPTGQHLELGIAESNLFTLLTALGLSHALFGTPLLPVGTLYDPFINRGLDALNYACYQGARFLLAATPSGITLAPEGGAHQSIHTPLIGMAQPGLTYFEPAFADELVEIMRWSLTHLQAPDGGAVYLRLSTRPMTPPSRTLTDAQVDDLLAGAYWVAHPTPEAEAAIVATGAVTPEAMEAWESMLEDCPGMGLLAVTSPDLLHRDWTAAQWARARGEPATAHIERLLAVLPTSAGLATVIDGPPATLSWLGGVRGHRVCALGVDRFGQSGDIPDLYRAYRLDADAIMDAVAEVALPAALNRLSHAN
jgi:pyruvate dehydrogenase E1 component